MLDDRGKIIVWAAEVVKPILANFIDLLKIIKKIVMKKILLAMVALVTIAASGYAQKSHPNSPHDTVSTANITVTYGRPYKKGREIFGKLEAYGKVWRVGADEATTITFKKDGFFGNKPVKAGTYAMFAIPRENEWEFILNSQPVQWGAYDHDKNLDKDVLQVSTPVKKLDNVVEQLTISFPKANSMVVEWDKTQVTVPVK